MKLLVLVFSFLLFGFVTNAQTKKVLFIGNSYTAVNNLPNMVAQIATSLGDTLIYDSSTPGGYTFYAHSIYSTTLSKINSNGWDYVVLQAQSQEPSFPPAQVETETYPYADTLVRLIRENDTCTKVIFYMTWGRKNGDASNCASYPMVCTYEGMQYRLRYSYLEMANMFNEEVAPVGVVWRTLRHIDSTLNLYQADASHPNVLGTYAAACTFYISLFHKPVVGAFVPSGITAAEANLIQTTAQDIVFDSLSTWRIDTLTSFSDYTYDLDSTGFIHLIASTSGSDSYQWNVDGTNYFGQDIYVPFTGSSEVELLVERHCKMDSASSVINATSLPELESSTVLVYPNPFTSTFKISGLERFSFNVFAIDGKLLLNGDESQLNQVNKLAKGTYMLQLSSEGKIINRVIIKD